MERKRATDFPQGLLDLFDHYVHGEISRRKFLDGATKFAAGGLTAAALWESLRPNYALAQQVPPDDKRLDTERATVPRHRAMGAYADTMFVPRTLRKNCLECWSFTRTAASILTSKTWRAAWEPQISSPLRQMA